MNNQKIISDYIAECVDKGICSQKEIYEKIKRELLEKDKILASVEDIRIERSKLQKICDHFNTIFQAEKAVSSFDDNSKEAVELRSQIVDVIRKQNKPLSNREIINLIGNYAMDAKVIRAIKTLHENQIIDRTNDNEHKIIPGPKWE